MPNQSKLDIDERINLLRAELLNIPIGVSEDAVARHEIKELIRDVLEYVKPMRYDIEPKPPHLLEDEDYIMEEWNTAIDKMEAMIRRLGLSTRTRSW